MLHENKALLQTREHGSTSTATFIFPYYPVVYENK